MFEFMLFGTFWFYGIFAFISLFILINIFRDNDGGLWLFGILFVLFLFLSGTWTFAWAIDNPMTTLMWTGIYIGTGLIWSIKEWYDLVTDTAKKYAKSYKNKVELKESLQQELSLSNHWGEIVQWIIYFPYLMLAWILDEPVKKIAKQFSFIYNGITNRIINKTINK